MRCRICDHPELENAVDLGLQPWANNFLRREDVGKEPSYPLRVVYCPKCQLAQLDFTVPKEVMFTDHTYVSGTTETLRKHFQDVASYIDQTFFAAQKNKAVLDIGSNDGTQLLQYKSLGYDVQGVESCAPIAKQAEARGVPTLSDFFNLETAGKLGRTFHVINASGVFFHLEELHSVTEAVRTCLREDGVFVVQFLYMKSIVENLAFDQIYHEHLLYYTLTTIEQLLSRHGLASFDAYWSPIHGGSMVLMVSHKGMRKPSERRMALLAEEKNSKINELKTYRDFARRIELSRTDTLRYLDGAKAKRKRLYGMGAPVKGNTLLNYYGIGTQYLDFLVEKNPLRKGLYSPGMHIPIILEEDVVKQPDIYFVLAWNFKKEILQRHKALVDKGVEFYFPVNPKEAA